MCRSALHDLLVALPKCEHHMHLEGSLEPDLLFELAEKKKIQLPTDDDAFGSVETLLARYRRFTSLDDFLHYYFIGMTVLLDAGDFEALAYAYFTKAHSQRVIHAEVFFDPQAHTSRGVDYSTVVDGFVRAQERARRDYGMSSELIVCLLRHFTPGDCYTAYQEFVPDLKSGRVAGLGLSSTEKDHPPSLYRQPFGEARRDGFKLTAHAGEEADVSYMRGAVEDLSCTRVDHGIRLRDDMELMKRFARERILITMCPLSNLELNCVRSVSELPIREYIDNKVPFSLNSDDPAYFDSYIQENYCAVQDAFHLTRDEWEQLVTNSITLSWCSDERKQEMLRDLARTLREQSGQS